MKAKKLIALLLAAILCFSLAATAAAEGLKGENSGDVTVTVEDDDEAYDDIMNPFVESIETFTNETVSYYNQDVDEVSDLEVWFINGNREVPYLSLESIIEIMGDVYQNFDDYALTLSKLTDDWDIFALTRENGAVMTVDYEANCIIFDDIDLFFTQPTSVNGLDIVELTTNGADDNMLIDHANVFYRNPDAVTVCLDDYCIPMIYQDGTGYLPLQTVADLLVSRSNLFLLYNGQAVLLSKPDDVEAPEEDETDTDEAAEPELRLYDIYYSAPAATKSDMLRIFNYNELCLAMDYSYGLQSEHEITSFNHLFIQTGLADQLMSDNAGDTFTALSTMTLGYFADLHSTVLSHSYMESMDEAAKANAAYGYDMSAYVYAVMEHLICRKVYQQYRALYYPDGCPAYEEVGDTAYITFDHFLMNDLRGDPDFDYYTCEPTASLDDTLELIMYANEQIHRENSPIQNVVIDLTNNGGGECDTAASLVAWMLGSCTLSLEDTISGAQSTTSYTFDANRDGQFDENDYLGAFNYNLYCLISPCSFSCGNLVPAALSANHFVTLIGDSSTGGACCVYPMSTADGTMFQVSGPYRISTMNNGIYYSVDQGVTPDDYIDKIEHLYDREYLTDYINNLA